MSDGPNAKCWRLVANGSAWCANPPVVPGPDGLWVCEEHRRSTGSWVTVNAFTSATTQSYWSLREKWLEVVWMLNQEENR